jgi:putative membrane protein
MLRAGRVLALGLAVVGAGGAACRGDSEPGPGDTTSTMVVSGAPDTAQPESPVTDSHILALLDWAHQTDSAAATLAITKGTSSEVRAFARLLLRDHRSLRAEGERVARRLRIVTQLPPGDQSEAEMAEILRLLNTTTRGRDFDKAYVDHEAAYHLDVLETAVTAMQMARAAEVQAYIQRLAPMLQGHLDRAQQLQASFR